MERTTVMPQARAAAIRRRFAAGRTTPWIDLLATWLERARQRRALQRLDDRMLKDIGLSRADVAHESDKPFWR